MKIYWLNIKGFKIKIKNPKMLETLENKILISLEINFIKRNTLILALTGGHLYPCVYIYIYIYIYILSIQGYELMKSGHESYILSIQGYPSE